MSQTIVLPDGVFERLDHVAAANRLTPAEWIERQLSIRGLSAPSDSESPLSMEEFLERVDDALGETAETQPLPEGADRRDSIYEDG